MSNRESVLAQIVSAFRNTPYPGDAHLQGSFEGCEPFEEIAPFKGRTDWQALDSRMLDIITPRSAFSPKGAFASFFPLTWLPT